MYDVLRLSLELAHVVCAHPAATGAQARHEALRLLQYPPSAPMALPPVPAPVQHCCSTTLAVQHCCSTTLAVPALQPLLVFTRVGERKGRGEREDMKENEEMKRKKSGKVRRAEQTGKGWRE